MCWQCEQCALPGLPVAGQAARPPYLYISIRFRFVGQSQRGGLWLGLGLGLGSQRGVLRLGLL